MTTKRGIGSYPEDDAQTAPDGGGLDQVDGTAPGLGSGGASPDAVKRASGKGARKPRVDDKAERASDPGDIQDKLDKYRDEMAEDAPASDDQADRN